MDLAAQENFNSVNPLYYHFDIGGKFFDVYDIEKELVGKESFIDHIVLAAFEYIIRYKCKNGVEDLKKARNCLNKAIYSLENDV